MDAAIHTIRYDNLPSAFVAARPVDLWLPPGYENGPPCAVLYMHDGQNLFDPQQSYTGITWGVAEALSALITAGHIPPALVVGIHNTPNRFGEYMPTGAIHLNPETQRRFGEWVAEEDDSQDQQDTADPPPQLVADNYLRFIVEELKPFVDAHYRTRPQAAHTAILGSSMGGLISAYAFCEYPDVFHLAGCLSTHWPIADGLMLDYLAASLPDPAGRRIYFDHGGLELDATYAPYQQRANLLLEARGYRPEAEYQCRTAPEHPHHESAWRARLPGALEFLLGAP